MERTGKLSDELVYLMVKVTSQSIPTRQSCERLHRYQRHPARERGPSANYIQHGLPFFSAYERYCVQAKKSGACLLGNKLGEKMKDALKPPVADFMDREAW